MNKKYKYTKEQEEYMIKLYKDGCSIADITLKTGIKNASIFRILERNNIPRNRNICGNHYNEETQKIFYETYIKDHIYIPYDKTIEYKNSKPKYSYDSHYFDNIDNQDKAYILGLIYADGNMNRLCNFINLTLQERDVSILEKIKELISSNCPLVFNKSPNPNWQNTYTLFIRNRQMCDALKYHGVIPCKSLVLKFPMNLSENLYKDFLRGYYDGDGCFNKCNGVSSFASTDDFCNDARLYIENKLNINCYIGNAHAKNDITKNLIIGGKKNTKIFLDWLYSDANLFLQRKYDSYINYFYSNDSLSYCEV